MGGRHNQSMRFFLPTPSRAAAAAALLAACCAWSTGAVAQKSSNGRSAAASPVRGSTPYATRDDAMKFADEVAERRGLDRDWVRATIGSARFLPNVPRLMLPGPVGTVKNWQTYRSRFIDPVRIAAGVRF